MKAMASISGAVTNLMTGLSPDGGAPDYLACARCCDALGDDLRTLAGATQAELQAALATYEAQQSAAEPPPPPPPPPAP